MNRSLLLILVGVLCPSVGDAGRPDEDVYEPLAVGLRWEFSVEITLSSGEMIHGTAIREITGTETIAGKSYFESVTRYTGLPQTPPLVTYQRKAENGIYSIDKSDPEQREHRETALPLILGQSWIAGTPEARATFRVEAEQSVAAAGSTYDQCLKVAFHSEGGSSHGTYYVAPRVGIVLDTAERDGVRYRLTLLSFSNPLRGAVTKLRGSGAMSPRDEARYSAQVVAPAIDGKNDALSPLSPGARSRLRTSLRRGDQ